MSHSAVLKDLQGAQRDHRGCGSADHRVDELHGQHIPTRHSVDECNQVEHAPAAAVLAFVHVGQALVVLIALPAFKHGVPEDVVGIGVAAEELLHLEGVDHKTDQNSDQQTAQEYLQQELSIRLSARDHYCDSDGKRNADQNRWRPIVVRDEQNAYAQQ